MPSVDQIKEYREGSRQHYPQEPKPKKGHDLPELPNAEKGKVVTRLPPEPSKYSHLGHALSFIINYSYALKYDGKCLLKLEDTNPEKCTKEFADAMIDDLTNYLEIKADKIIFISDDMDHMYGQAEKLIMKDKAYVCFCTRDKMQDLRHKGMECECRVKPPTENIAQWKDMVGKRYKEEECTLRLKARMQSENQAMRDPVIFRITYAPHFRHGDKYCAWPLYDFENSVEDAKYGVTHVLRSIEFGSMRTELQNYIKDILELPQQIIKEYGRFNITGANTQGREIRKLIEEGKVSGWDDPSLVTLKALKRRGIVRETYYELMYEVGLSPNTSKNLDWSMISAINRRILDQKVNRYFFIDSPARIRIEGAPTQKLELKLHPEQADRGKREFSTGNEFYISEEDKKRIKTGDVIRLMDCLNFRKEPRKFVFDSLEHENFKKRGKLIIHWLPVSQELMDVEVRMPDNSVRKGIGEHYLRFLKEGDIVQFARFGFCRLDKIEFDRLQFWFTNK